MLAFACKSLLCAYAHTLNWAQKEKGRGIQKFNPPFDNASFNISKWSMPIVLHNNKKLSKLPEIWQKIRKASSSICPKAILQVISGIQEADLGYLIGHWWGSSIKGKGNHIFQPNVWKKAPSEFLAVAVFKITSCSNYFPRKNLRGKSDLLFFTNWSLEREIYVL